METTTDEPLDRVAERQRAVALARHYREAEGLSIAQIAERLGRAPATVKAYFYDPSDANKRPTDSPAPLTPPRHYAGRRTGPRREPKHRRPRRQPLSLRPRRARPGRAGRSRRAMQPLHRASRPPSWEREERQEVASSGVVCPPRHHEERPFTDGLFLRLGWLSSISGRLEVLMLDRVTDRRRAAQLARHYRDQEGLSIAEIARRLGRAEATIRRISTIQPAPRHARSRRATEECVAAAGRPPRHGTARATPTRIANAAIPARLRRNGRGNGFAKRCAHGERATALRRPPTTGPAPTHAGAAAKRSNDYRPTNGPHRPLSSICTGVGRRPAPTPSAAPERLGVNAVDIRTRACAWPSVTAAPRWPSAAPPQRPNSAGRAR